jgi:hypothetical protein
MSNNGSNGSKPITPEPDGEHDLGRFHSLEAKQHSLANLRPWSSEAGHQLGMLSGSARRRNALFKRELERQLAKRVVRGEPETWREKVARKLIRKAAAGDVPAARLLIERVDGLPSSLEDLLEPQRIMVVVNRNVSRFNFAGEPDPDNPTAKPPLHE